MAQVPHEIGAPRRGPGIILPITSRGIELTDRACWAILAAAMAVSAALLMYVSRGTTFGIDEVEWVADSLDFGLADAFDPYNGSLIATTRIVYKAILETVGAEYVAFRVLWVASVLLSGGVLYEVMKRRIGAVAALAPAVVMLFFGSAGPYFTGAVGFTAMFAIATGLGALLALERDDRVGDLAACVLVCVSVATFSIGLGFLVGVAISVLARRDRASRAWIFLVPLVLYGIWWLSATGSGESSGDVTQTSNVLLIPSYVADSLAASLAALTGLNYDFTGSTGNGSSEIAWGFALAVLAVGALGYRVARGKVERSVWVSLGVILTVWVGGALAFSILRQPDSTRYMYMGAVGVLLVATAAAGGVRITRAALVVIVAVGAFSLLTNLALLRDNAKRHRDASASARASFAMLELTRDDLDGTYRPPVVPFGTPPLTAAEYLEWVDRYGSDSLPPGEVGQQRPAARENADATLVGALGVELAPAAGPPSLRCETARPGGGAVALPAGGATLINRGDRPVTVRLGRFAEPSASVGRVAPGEPRTIAIHEDASPAPWLASVSGSGPVVICGRGGA